MVFVSEEETGVQSDPAAPRKPWHAPQIALVMDLAKETGGTSHYGDDNVTYS